MSDFLKTVIEFERYLHEEITKKTDVEYYLTAEKKMAMLELYEQNKPFICFCNISNPCPCEKLNDMLIKNNKCKCNFIRRKKN
jgi:hypothetical protein